MLKVVNGTLADLADAIIQTRIVKLHRSAILMRLTHLRKSPEMFGEVDLENQQQVELAAYRVAKGVQKQVWWELKRTDEYALVIVGAGSTAAYYLDTLGPAHNRGRAISARRTTSRTSRPTSTRTAMRSRSSTGLRRTSCTSTTTRR